MTNQAQDMQVEPPSNTVLMSKLNELFAGIGTMQASMQGNFGTMNDQFGALTTHVNEPISAVQGVVQAVQTRLDVVSVDVSSMKSRQDTLENEMKRMRCASSNASTAAATTPSPAKW